jgi:hypothetical protein
MQVRAERDQLQAQLAQAAGASGRAKKVHAGLKKLHAGLQKDHTKRRRTNDDLASQLRAFGDTLKEGVDGAKVAAAASKKAQDAAVRAAAAKARQEARDETREAARKEIDAAKAGAAQAAQQASTARAASSAAAASAATAAGGGGSKLSPEAAGAGFAELRGTATALRASLDALRAAVAAQATALTTDGAMADLVGHALADFTGHAFETGSVVAPAQGAGAGGGAATGGHEQSGSFSRSAAGGSGASAAGRGGAGVGGGKGAGGAAGGSGAAGSGTGRPRTSGDMLGSVASGVGGAESSMAVLESAAGLDQCSSSGSGGKGGSGASALAARLDSLLERLARVEAALRDAGHDIDGAAAAASKEEERRKRRAADEAAKPKQGPEGEPMGESGCFSLSRDGGGEDSRALTAASGAGGASRGGLLSGAAGQGGRPVSNAQWAKDWGDGSGYEFGEGGQSEGPGSALDGMHRGTLPSAWRKQRARGEANLVGSFGADGGAAMVSALPKRALKPLSWLLKRMELVYDAKLSAEQADCREGSASLPLGEELKDWAMRTFGVKGIVQGMCSDIVTAVAAYRKRQLAVEIFASFLEGSQPAEELSMLLICRAAVMRQAGGADSSSGTGFGAASLAMGGAGGFSAAGGVGVQSISLSSAVAILERYIGGRLSARYWLRALRRLGRLADGEQGDGDIGDSSEEEEEEDEEGGGGGATAAVVGEVEGAAAADAETKQGGGEDSEAAGGGVAADADGNAQPVEGGRRRAPRDGLFFVPYEQRISGFLPQLSGAPARVVVPVPRFMLLCVREFRLEQQRFVARLQLELVARIEEGDGGGSALAAPGGEATASVRLGAETFMEALLAAMPHWPDSVVILIFDQVRRDRDRERRARTLLAYLLACCRALHLQLFTDTCSLACCLHSSPRALRRSSRRTDALGCSRCSSYRCSTTPTRSFCRCCARTLALFQLRTPAPCPPAPRSATGRRRCCRALLARSTGGELRVLFLSLHVSSRISYVPGRYAYKRFT